MKSLIAISHIDTIKKKNIRDIVCLSKLQGFTFEVFSYSGHSLSQPSLKSHIYRRNLFSRALQYTAFILTRKKDLNHVEIYTGCGNFWILECLICSILDVKVVACERGTPLLNISKNSQVVRFAKVLALRYLTNAIWIRELWMNDILNSLNIPAKKLIFIPNAINLDDELLTQRKVQTNASFLWVNSFKEFRHLDWVYNVFNDLSVNKSDYRLTVLGDLSDKGITPCQINQTFAGRIKSSLIGNLLPFCEPYDFYLTHTFFILPADIVYLNNSLLESMSYGCVPILSDVDGARLIVPDSSHGILFNNDEKSFKTAVSEALSLTDAQIRHIQTNIIKHIRNNFSIQAKAQKILKMYKDLDDNINQK